MTDEILTQELLTRLLKEAEKAHANFERELQHRDDDWASWYASFILRSLPKTQAVRKTTQD